MRRKNESIDELLAGNIACEGTVTSGAFVGDITGDITGDIVATAATGESGVGVVGTGAAISTTRRIEGGTIITEIKIDLTGLASVATANDVIGLAAGGAAYIGRNVILTNGIIYKTEFSCIETPVGGDLEVNVVNAASAELAYDGAGGTTYISDSGLLVIGQTIQNLVPAITANYYYYLTGGAGDAAAAYTAGQFILRTYGHAALA